MNKADLIAIPSFDTIEFYRNFRNLTGDDKAEVARQVLWTFDREKDNYFSSGKYISAESLDYYIDLCEKVLLIGTSMDFAPLHYDILSKKGFFDGSSSKNDMPIKNRRQITGTIGRELRWLEKNFSHKDFSYRLQLTKECLARLNKTLSLLIEYNDKLIAQSGSDKDTLKRIKTMLAAGLTYYKAATAKLSETEQNGKSAKKGVIRSDRNNICDPFRLFENADNMSETEKNELRQNAISNVRADGYELAELQKKNKTPKSAKCDGYMNNIEALMMINNSPMFDSPAVAAMDLLLKTTQSSGDSVTNKTIYGSLKVKIEQTQKTVNEAIGTSISDVGTGLGFTALLAAVCAFLIFNPVVKTFFRSTFFYKASYIICAVLDIFIVVYIGFFAFICFTLIAGFIFGTLQEIIGIGVALKWVIIIAIGIGAAACMYYTVTTFIDYLKSINADKDALRAEAEIQLDICSAYVKKCKDYLSKLSSNRTEAHKYGLCDKNRYDYIKEALPDLNAYYMRATNDIVNMRRQLGK